MSAYISRDTLREWRAACDGESDFHETRILRLIDALEAPCGSCHPCNDWAAETWRRSGGPLPHKYQVDEAFASLARIRALVDELDREDRDARSHGADNPKVSKRNVVRKIRAALAAPGEEAVSE